MHLVVLTSDKYIVYDLLSKTVSSSFRSFKKEKKMAKNPESPLHALPSRISLSHDDRFSVEVQGEVVVMRQISSNTIVAKFEGHSQPIRLVEFAMPTPEQLLSLQGKRNGRYAFVSSAGTECLLWEHAVKGEDGGEGKIEEVLAPAKILDSESLNEVGLVRVLQVMEGAYLVLTLTNKNKGSIFMAKVKHSSHKQSQSKVKRADSQIVLEDKSHEFLGASFLSDTVFSLIHGNMFSMLQQKVLLFDKDASKPQIRSQISISNNLEQVNGQAKKKAGKQDDYEVVGIDTMQDIKPKVGGAAQSTPFQLFNINDAKNNLEALKAASAQDTDKNAIQGGSLATILQQALVSEDEEQLNWLLLSSSNSGSSLIEKTVVQIQDEKMIQLLIRKILDKFQSQQAANPDSTAINASAISVQLSSSLWLKYLLKYNWHRMIGSGSASDLGILSDLVSLKNFIEEKNRNLQQLLLVKGKLEMLKNTYQVQDVSQKYWKIKSNLKKQRELVGQANSELAGADTLVYKDASDDENQLDKILS
mmetsp:Transcript_952/g.1685  ORF Transcript_952/g.1685 Transcript_952/m.1685 type:complete len:531 (+) Transcript_952:472-2064(+)